MIIVKSREMLRLFSSIFPQSAVHYLFSLSPPSLTWSPIRSNLRFKDTRQAAYHVQVEQKQLNLKSDPPPEAGKSSIKLRDTFCLIRSSILSLIMNNLRLIFLNFHYRGTHISHKYSVWRSDLSTWKYQFSYNYWRQATLSSVSTWMGDCSSVAANP